MSGKAIQVNEASVKYLAKTEAQDALAGYKQTERDVIPEDWECVSFGSVIDLLTGFPFPSADYANSGVLLVRGSNVKRGVLDWNEDITKYWPAVTADIARYELRKGDIVIAMDGALVGRSYATMSKADLPSLLLQRVARIRSSVVNQSLLGCWVASDYFVQHVDSVKTHTAIPHISPRDIRNFQIVAPSDPGEQRAIAEALSDVDGLLGALEALIAKKRAIKQAAMQQLLTGETRLPGFSGEWDTKRLGQLGATYGGLTSKSKDDFGHGDASYITFMNIMSNTVIDCDCFESVVVNQNETQNLVEKGDLFFNGSSETPEEVGMCAVLLKEVKGVYLNSFCFGFRPYEGAPVNGLYLAYYFRSGQGRELLKSLGQGATRYNLSKTALLAVSFPLPSIKEQTAIAAVLADMDVEIAAIEARRDKTRALKQGMMQQLLTGKIRLV